MKSLVLGLVADNQTRAYPVDLIARQKVINDQLGSSSLVIFCVDDYMQAFDSRVGPDNMLTFAASDPHGRFIDDESGSEWSATGECISGAYEGRQLSTIPHYNKIFWYVWSDYHPGGEIFGEESS
jgi:hypothetical protein